MGYVLMPKTMERENNYRVKWTQSCKEIDYANFKEGFSLANHFSNSPIVFTQKDAAIEMISKMEFNLQNKLVESEIFKSTKEFWQDSYRLDNLPELKEFLKAPN